MSIHEAKNVFYPDSRKCRQTYMHGAPQIWRANKRTYIHPNVGEIDLTGVNMGLQDRIIAKNAVIRIWINFLSKIPYLKKHIKRDKNGLYWDTLDGDAAVHLILGFTRNIKYIIKHCGPDIDKWGWEEFGKAIQLSNPSPACSLANGIVDSTHNSMIAKFFCVVSGLRRVRDGETYQGNDGRFGRTTDNMKIAAGEAYIPPQLKLTSADEQYLTEKGVKAVRKHPSKIVIELP